MVFPIVTGSALSSSSLPVPAPTDVIRNAIASEERYENAHHHQNKDSASSASSDGVKRRMIGTPLVTVGTDASSTLAATMTISYVETVADDDHVNDEANNEQQQNHHHNPREIRAGLTAEVRVSIAPVASSLSKSTRETTCRVRLPPSSGRRHDRTTRYGLTDVCPSVVFSCDGRYLACLIPCPVPLVEGGHARTEDGNDGDICVDDSNSSISSSGSGAHHHIRHKYSDTSPPLSSLVIFTLKRPARRPAASASAAGGPPDLPPLPGSDGQHRHQYHHHHHHYDERDGVVVIPVASSPRSLSMQMTGKGGKSSSRVDRITSICPASSSSSPTDIWHSGVAHHHPNAHASTSVLLAGTADGSILAVGYRRAKVAGVLYRPPGRKRPAPTSSTTSIRSHEQKEEEHSNMQLEQSAVGPDALISMDHVAPESYSSAVNAGVGGGTAKSKSGGTGRLAVVRADGSVIIYRSLFVPTGASAKTNDGKMGPDTNLTPPGIERNESDGSFRGAADLGDSCSVDGASVRTPLPNDSNGSLDSVRKSIRFTPSTLAGAPGSVKATTIGLTTADGSLPEPPPRPARSSSVGSASTGKAGAGAGLMMKIERLAAIRPGDDIPPFVRGNWLNIGVIVLLARPYQPGAEDMTPRHPTAASRTPRGSTGSERKKVVAQIWRVMDDFIPISVATLRVAKDELVELSHGIFQLRHAPQMRLPITSSDHNQVASNEATSTNVPLAYSGPSLGVSCHRGSDCIALSSSLLVLAKTSDGTSTHVASRFAQGNGEADFAGTSTPSHSIRRQKDVHLRPFVCIWDWRNSVLGMTLRSSVDQAIPQQLMPHDAVAATPSSTLCSRLLFTGQMARIIHMRAGSRRVQKDLYEFGLLSPSSVEKREQGSVEEASPLVISPNCIAFPLIMNSTVNQDSTVLWREARIPSTYASANGPARIAAIGRRLGRSIAVSSSRGLCILDLSLMVANNNSSARSSAPNRDTHDSDSRTPCVTGHICSDAPDAVPVGMKNVSMKWRLFRNESEEQSFRVVAMTWWERSCLEKSSSEDLLVAAIEYIPGDNETVVSQSNQYYLVCWSRRRLGLGQYQLLGEADASLDSGRKEGIALPKGLEPNSLSILAEQTGHKGNGPQHGHHGMESTRAVVLISSSRQGSVTYMAYQLQAIDTTPISVIDAPDSHKTSQVLSRLCSTGRMPLLQDPFEGSSVSPFLAGASFQFDLSQNASATGFDTHAYVATVGLVQGDGSLAAVCITPFGPSFGGVVLPQSRLNDETYNDITNFWLADVIEGITLHQDGESLHNAFVWTITRNDGKVFCWRVPFFVKGETKARASSEATLPQSSSDSGPRATIAESSFRPPSVVSASNIFLPRDTGFPTEDAPRSHYFLGKACYVGDSSLINGNTTNDNELAIGPLPPFTSGCILYLGQQSRNLHPRLPDSAEAFSPHHSHRTISALHFNVFGASECIVGPATITTSLFFAFLDIASSSSSHTEPSLRYVEHTLFKRQSDDVIFSVLRIVVLRTVAVLASLKKRPGYKEAEAFIFARALLFEVVSTARSALTPLKFCSLFLGLGRQIEPHDFSALFPLPCSLSAVNRNQGSDDDPHPPLPASVYTVEDLFLESIRCGSIAVASASLPLFSSKSKALRWCKQLLWQCLSAVRDNISEVTPTELDTSAEEKIFIRQLYKFGLKLEDVAIAESTAEEDFDGDDGEVDMSFDTSLYESYEYSDDGVVSTSAGIRGMVLNNDAEPPSRMSRLVSMITPMLWDMTPSQEEIEEKAISEAASMFIYSVFDETDNAPDTSSEAEHPEISTTSIDESLLTVVGDEDSDIDDAATTSRGAVCLPALRNRSIAGIICEFIAADFVTKSWKKIACVAILLNEGSTLPAAGAISNAKRLLRSISEDDLASCPAAALGEPGTDGTHSIPGLLVHIQLVSYHLDKHASGLIFDMIVSLLMKHDKHEDVEKHTIPLILVAIVAGHVAGRVEELMGHAEDSVVGRRYSTSIAGID